MFFLIFLSLVQEPSIHQIEYESHLKGAVFTEISQTPFVFVPLQVKSRDMLKDYYGYCPYWTDTIYYDYFQMDLLTHIAYFSVEIDPSDGSLGSIPYLSRFNKIRDHGHAHGVRIHMTFTLFGSSSVTTFLNNATARQNTIAGISDFMTNYGVEGANIDFEFVTSSVRDSFNLFIDDLSTELWGHANGRKDVYIASIAVPEWYPGYDVDYLADHCDGLFIMAYDFHWSGSSTAGPVSPCIPSSFWGQYCAAKSIGSYKIYGVDGSKIILGIPYYGLDWPTVGPDKGSATTGTGSAVIYYYAFGNAITHGRLWDDYSLTPWYCYQSTDWHQCWYDDSVSLDIKFGMVNDSLLQGAGCWALGYDRSYDHIWNAVRRNFWDPQAIVEAENTPVMRLNTASIFSDVLKLSGFCPDEEYHIIVYDVSGRRIIKRRQSGIVQLEIGKDLRAGIYFLYILNGDSVIGAKVIKIK